jgi:sugar/nucleoside kinase (ribokinase family)
MPAAPLDVLALGNAIVDVIANATPAFLAEVGVEEDSMRLISETEADALYAKMGPGREVSGGSAGNSAAALAQLGSKVGYVGKVRNDQLGKVFSHDIRSVGVEFTTTPAEDGPASACCLILVPPSGKRAMNTYLGCASNLDPEDLDVSQIARAQYTLIEGYAWAADRMRATAKAATLTAHRHGNKVALGLAADWIAGNKGWALLDFARGHVDVLFANEAEALALTGAPDFDSALFHLRGLCEVVVMTRGEKGAVVLSGDETVEVQPHPVAQVVDTTGAGDLFCAGFLHGLSHGKSLSDAGRLGALCAAEVISQIGARPTRDLKALAAAAGL